MQGKIISQIVCLPPHTSHRMQPLDVGFMFTLKSYYGQEIETLWANNPNRVVTPYLISKLFGLAYKKAATMETYVNALKKKGPCNQFIFRDHDFAIHSQHEDQNHHAANESVIKPQPGNSKCSEPT
jgi:hypothetical protein